jgi:hypothetical protein
MTNFISLSEDGSSTEKMSLAQLRRENSMRYLKPSAVQLRQFSEGMDMDSARFGAVSSVFDFAIACPETDSSNHFVAG